MTSATDTPDTDHHRRNAIDEADGVLDGNLFPVLATRIGHEKHMVERLKDVEDRTADRITAFAGSLPFVYIHSVCNSD